MIQSYIPADLFFLFFIIMFFGSTNYADVIVYVLCIHLQSSKRGGKGGQAHFIFALVSFHLFHFFFNWCSGCHLINYVKH